MKLSEFLRAIADKVDELIWIQPDEATEMDTEAPLSTMVPPLQQKMELLKRAVGIDNAFDGTAVDKDAIAPEDDLEIIKKNTGINPGPAALLDSAVANTGPTRPGIPSVIVTVTPVGA